VEVKRRTRRLNIVVSEPLHEELTEMAEKYDETKSEIVRVAVEREIERRKHETLEQAAELLAPFYEENKELLVFTSLDGEEFL
jgi:metal-responsive CopG/Arc/MetJ family transcriptional regulator